MKKLIILPLIMCILTSCSTIKGESITTTESTITTSNSQIAENTTISESTEPILTTTTEQKELTEVEQKLLNMKRKKITDYTEDDFIFLLNTDLSCHIKPFNIDSSEKLTCDEITGSYFYSYRFPTIFCKSISIYAGNVYLTEDYAGTISDLCNPPEMIRIDFKNSDIEKESIVLGKYTKGMNLEEVNKIDNGESGIFANERLCTEFKYYRILKEKVEYTLWFYSDDELMEIQIWKN